MLYRTSSMSSTSSSVVSMEDHQGHKASVVTHVSTLEESSFGPYLTKEDVQVLSETSCTGVFGPVITWEEFLD